MQSRYKRMKKGIPRGLEKWNRKRTERWERIRLIVSCFHLFIVLLIIQSKPLQWEFKNIAIIIILLMILSLFLVLLSPCHKTTHFKHLIDFITKRYLYKSNRKHKIWSILFNFAIFKLKITISTLRRNFHFPEF